MRRGPIFVAATALACLPAVTGLVGNQSFSHSVPVRVPSQARIGSPDAHVSPVQQPVQPRAQPKVQPPVQQPATGPSTTDGALDNQRGKAATGQPAEEKRFSPVPSALPRPESNSGKGTDDGRPAEESSHGLSRASSGDDNRGHQ
jgi:hypothetical protein